MEDSSVQELGERWGGDNRRPTVLFMTTEIFFSLSLKEVVGYQKD